MRRGLAVLLSALLLSLTAVSAAEQPAAVAPGTGHGAEHDHAAHDHAAHDHGAHGAAAPGAEPAAHGAEPSAHGDAHAAHGDDHVTTFDDFNWYHGLFFEKEGVEPSLLYRPKGMPVPFAALLFDCAILYFLLFRFMGRPVREGLKRRKDTLLRGMEEAAKMKREAEGQLAFYEEKLAKIDQDVAELRQRMRHAAETESARILSEAKERRTRMERDAHQLVEQELKAVQERLSAETIAGALCAAEQSLLQRITEADQQRFGDEYLAGLPQAAASLRGRL